MNNLNLTHRYFNLIIATDSETGGIGKNNALPWKCKEDMKHFKGLTKDNIVIMGGNTFRSIGKPLEHRTNLIISRRIDGSTNGVIVFNSIESVIQWCRQFRENKNIFVMGGSEIYNWFLDHPEYVQTIYHSKIHGNTNTCDTFIDVKKFESFNVETFNFHV
jgi:dihydrofolate reductase